MEEEHKKDTAQSTATPKTGMLACGVNVTKKVITNWKKQAEKPRNKTKQIDALRNLADCYSQGICVDKEETHELLQKLDPLGLRNENNLIFPSLPIF